MDKYNNGGFGNIFQIDNDTLMKLFYRNPDEYDLRINVELLENLKRDKVEGFYLIKDTLYDNNKLIGYTMKKYNKRDNNLNMLTMESNYVINNFNRLYNAIMYIKKYNLEPTDLCERNIIIGNEYITIIDVDLYTKLGVDASIICDFYLGNLWYGILANEAHRLGLDFDQKLLNKLFRDYNNDFKNNPEKILSNYKYPIDYLVKKR